MIRPPPIRQGDTIGIVAPASAPPDPDAIDRGVSALRKLGFPVKLARNVRQRLGYLAGSDAQRASDLMEMFSDPEVRGIICVRGGYGCARLLPLLDYQLIRNTPKVLVGYSDITSLHLALLMKADLVSFHGPMLNSDFARPDLSPFTLARFFSAVSHAEPAGSICKGYHGGTVQPLSGGKAQGPLVGGNLTLLCSGIGTEWQLAAEGCILFFEDVDEKPYKFDRMLTQLLSAGLLEGVAGIAVGINKDCEDPKAGGGEYRQTVEEVLKERLLPLKVPLVSGLPFGHTRDIATLPLGVEAFLDGDKGDLVVSDAAVGA